MAKNLPYDGSYGSLFGEDPEVGGVEEAQSTVRSENQRALLQAGQTAKGGSAYYMIGQGIARLFGHNPEQNDPRVQKARMAQELQNNIAAYAIKNKLDPNDPEQFLSAGVAVALGQGNTKEAIQMSILRRNLESQRRSTEALEESRKAAARKADAWEKMQVENIKGRSRDVDVKVEGLLEKERIRGTYGKAIAEIRSAARMANSRGAGKGDKVVPNASPAQLSSISQWLSSQAGFAEADLDPSKKEDMLELAPVANYIANYVNSKKVEMANKNQPVDVNILQAEGLKNLINEGMLEPGTKRLFGLISPKAPTLSPTAHTKARYVEAPYTKEGPNKGRIGLLDPNTKKFIKWKDE